MAHQKKDFRITVEKYLKERKPNHRYTAFDYCYNHFHPKNFDSMKFDMKESCLVLYNYLANWGMLRNSFLMQANYEHLIPTIRYIAASDPHLWKIDVDCYTDNNIKNIVTTCKDIKEKLALGKFKPSVILTTKILLGVYGFVPAFDGKFGNTFRIIFEDCGFRSCNAKACQRIRTFYEDHKPEIDDFHKSIRTIDFLTGKTTSLRYPKAKIIDMYGFQKAGLKNG